MSHILVAIATPTASPSMFAPLADLARRLGSELTVLEVLTAGGAHPGDALAQGRQTAENLCEHLKAEGLSCAYRPVEAIEDIPGAVLAAAAEVGATLIVMGMAGKSTFVRRTGGDIPSQLLSRTTLPVLLLPPVANATV